MDGDWWLFFFRLGAVGTLYLFLAHLTLTLHRSLREEKRGQPAANSQPRLVVVDGGTTSLANGKIITLHDTLTIGRAQTNSIPLEDPYVSADHSVIRQRDGMVWVEDVGSTNGTYVNRRQIDSPTAIQPGDIVQIGQVKFKLLA